MTWYYVKYVSFSLIYIYILNCMGLKILLLPSYLYQSSKLRKSVDTNEINTNSPKNQTKEANFHYRSFDTRELYASIVRRVTRHTYDVIRCATLEWHVARSLRLMANYFCLFIEQLSVKDFAFGDFNTSCWWTFFFLGKSPVLVEVVDFIW